MSARIPLTFRIYRGDQLIGEETLTQGVVKIGKVISAHLRIDDESVSRMHAIIEVDGAGNVHVIDLGSTRGTFVNGQKVNKAKLETGDAMQIGALRVEIAFGASASGIQTSAADVRTPAIQNPAVDASVRTPAASLSVVPMPAMTVRPPAIPATAVRVTAPDVRPPAVPNPAVDVRTPAVRNSALRNSAVPIVPMSFAPQVADDDSGAKSIEVAAMLGDSVVGVKHCMDPKSGKVSSRTWATFAFGAACLVGSTIAFYASVSVAAFNKGGLDYWTRVLHRPAFAFRPETLGAGFDWLAFGGLAFGLVAMVMGLVRMRNEKRSPYFRIGTAAGVELPLDSAPSPSFPLVAPAADQNDFVFNYGEGMEGEMVLDGTTTSLAELVASGRAQPSLTTVGAIEVPIPARARIRARSGQTTFVVSAVSRPRRQAPVLAALESRTMAYFAGSLAVHIGLIVLLQQIPGDDSAAAITLASTEPTSINSSNNIREETPPVQDQTDGAGGQTDGKAAPMALESGQSGKPDITRTDGHLQIKDTNRDPQMARREAVEQAREMGIMGSVSAMESSFQSLTAIGDVSSGISDATVYGAIYGADGESHGYFGVGLSGFGRGGGCTHEPCGLIGTSDGFGTIGTGKHAGVGYAAGPGGFGPGGRNHDAQVPKPIIGQPTGGGDLDKSIIRRYIKRNIDKIGYCYEHELLAHPTLAGTISVEFFITPSGTVKASNGSGFDSTVASCVASVVAAIEFPRPQGGGGVNVNYPFTFRPAGQ